ncbi:MAG: relaxase/mobilization nuclease domain-containing protein [Clostridia bacterium]|nr:relaxase/mobilization nuclease domain-containing protein [Clostridia bacterium]
MATCNFIKESKQTPSAMRAAIRYVSQEKKTVDENGVRYISGVNCVGTLAFDEFMAAKNLYRKKNGIFFYQYTQSFVPGEIKSYAEAHEIGQELAREFFPEYEVLVATHLDAVSDGEQRIHNHFIVNSVSLERGRRLHHDNHTLERMRKTSDRICAAHGLSVLEPYVQTYEKKAIGMREYRSALKSESWKIRLICDINTAMTRCSSREEFCDLMCSAGYSVTWEDSRKYITYTCQNGMKVRDNKLHDEKYLKENMEDEFRIRIREKNTAGQSIEKVQGLYTDNDIAEDDLYVLGKRCMISKNVPQEIEYLERSALEGNIYAYQALCRMNENVVVALTTDIAYIVSGLAELFHDGQSVEDSTTLPHH